MEAVAGQQSSQRIHPLLRRKEFKENQQFLPQFFNSLFFSYVFSIPVTLFWLLYFSDHHLVLFSSLIYY